MDFNEAATDVNSAQEVSSKPDYVRMTIDSGIKPLELRFSQINSCYKKTPIAYRSFTNINSVIEGVMPPERYAYAADETDRGIRMSKWNISAASEALDSFEAAHRHVEFVSVRVSPQIVREVDFYSYLKDIVDEVGLKDIDKLCLEFPRTVFYEDHENVRKALLAMKLLKVKSMLSGCGEKDSPITPLFDLPFDFLLISPSVVELLDNRNKAEAAQELLNFFSRLGSKVIGDGVLNDDHISTLNHADAFGYIPSYRYKGEVEHGSVRMKIEEAVNQKEEAEA